MSSPHPAKDYKTSQHWTGVDDFMVTYRSVVDSATCANTTCLTVNSVAFSFFLAILRTSQQFLLEQESRSTNESWVYAVPKKVDSWPLQASLPRFL